MINIEKHAMARCVTIDLAWLAGSVTISLADDGTGFEPQMVRSNAHLGLKIMSARREINGRLTFSSRCSLGTELRLWLPVDAG